MKKERQIGVRVSFPAFFCLELEDTYKRSEGPHKALSFPDFVGLLVGLGLEAYRRKQQNAPPEPEPETEGEPEAEGEEWDWQIKRSINN